MKARTLGLLGWQAGARCAAPKLRPYKTRTKAYCVTLALGRSLLSSM